MLTLSQCPGAPRTRSKNTRTRRSDAKMWRSRRGTWVSPGRKNRQFGIQGTGAGCSPQCSCLQARGRVCLTTSSCFAWTCDTSDCILLEILFSSLAYPRLPDRPSTRCPSFARRLHKGFPTGMDFESPGDTWQYLETVLTVTTGVGGCRWHQAETQDAAKHPTVLGQLPTAKDHQLCNSTA